MLGWEYPPRLAGGLGKACQGLSQGLAQQGAQVFFVLPTFPERVSGRRLEVVGAKEVLSEAGWEFEPTGEFKNIHMPDAPEVGGISGISGISGDPGVSGVSTIRSDAQLFPYGTPPEGPMSENLKRVLARMTQDGPPSGEGIPAPETVSTPSVTPSFKPKQVAQPAQPEAETKEPTPPTPPISSQEIYGKNLWSEVEKFCVTVRHLADAHEVDVVHAHDWMTFPAAFEFQRVTGAPVFLHVHATEYDRSGENLNQEVYRIEREGFRRATHIFAVSRYTAGIIERLYGINRKKISVVYNAPDDSTKEFISAPPELERKPQVVFLGRLTFQKGPDHFLNAAALVSKVNPSARFIICGTGDMMDKLRQQAYHLGIENQVHFAGFVDPSGVDEILLHSQVLVMPSVSEPFGLVALEAIRCGIPVILSKQSGVREVLHRALQVDFWDNERLADQILAALRLPNLSRQLVEEGMVQIQQLSWDKSAQDIIEIYHRHLGSTYAQAIGGAHGH